MPPLPTHFAALIVAFALLFVYRSWTHARLLLIGAIFTPGRRTVAGVRRIMDCAHERRFANIYCIPNHVAWCTCTGGRILLYEPSLKLLFQRVVEVVRHAGHYRGSLASLATARRDRSRPARQRVNRLRR